MGDGEQNLAEALLCSGCGTALQSDNPDAPGYLPASAKDREHPICRRCYRIRHYGEFSRVVVPYDVYQREVSTIASQPGLVFYVLDVFDLPGSLVPGLHDLIGKSEVIAIVNKVDLLPREVHVQTLERWIRQELERTGIHASRVLFASGQTGRGREDITAALAASRHDLAYFVGMANVGKSTLLNQLLKTNERTDLFTASKVPGTTLGMVARSVALDGKVCNVVDTPGLIHGDRVIDHLCGACLKVAIPGETIRPRVYQLDPGQTLWLGGFARLDFVAGPHQPVVCYVSNDLVVHRSKLERAEAIGREHADDILKVPCPQCRRDLGELRPHVIRGERQRPLPGDAEAALEVPVTGCDLVLSGLGWISLAGHNFRGQLHAPSGVRVSLRPRLVGQLSRGYRS